jgi:hypothetical protein
MVVGSQALAAGRNHERRTSFVPGALGLSFVESDGSLVTRGVVDLAEPIPVCRRSPFP